MPISLDSYIGLMLVFVTGIVGCLIVDIIDKRTEPGYIPRRKRQRPKSLTK